MKKSFYALLSVFVLSTSLAFATPGQTRINYYDDTDTLTVGALTPRPDGYCYVFGQRGDSGNYAMTGFAFDPAQFNCVGSSTATGSIQVLSLSSTISSLIGNISSLIDGLSTVSSTTNNFVSTAQNNMSGISTTMDVGVGNGLSAGMVQQSWVSYVNSAISSFTSSSYSVASSTYNGLFPSWGFTKLNAISTTTATSTIRSMFSAGTGINIASGTIAVATRTETYSGTTDGSGNYTVTFGAPFSVTPNVQANLINPTDNQFARVVSRSSTTMTVNARSRTDVVGLLPSFANLSGATVDVSVIGK